MASVVNHSYSEHMLVQLEVVARVVVRAPNMVWELDIKYVYVQGEGRNVFLLCFEDARSTVERFINFYNADRLHFAIGNKTPREVYVKWKEENTERHVLSLSKTDP